MIENKIEAYPLHRIKISIIIPVYNTEQYLRKCLDSLLCQTLQEIEIICIDDNSSDWSGDIIKYYAQDDARFVYLSMSVNSGSWLARNRALEIAKGDYISFVDSDDFIIEKTAYEKMYNAALMKNADIISANIINYNEEQDILYPNVFTKLIKGTSFISPKEYGLPWYYQKNLFKRQLLRDNQIDFPNYKRWQDPVFLTKALIHSNWVCCLACNFYAYRFLEHTNFITSIVANTSEYKIDSSEKELDYIKHFRDVLYLLQLAWFTKMYFRYQNTMYNFLLKRKITFNSTSLEDNIKNVFWENSKEWRKYKMKFFSKWFLYRILRFFIFVTHKTCCKIYTILTYKERGPD